MQKIYRDNQANSIHFLNGVLSTLGYFEPTGQSVVPIPVELDKVCTKIFLISKDIEQVWQLDEAGRQKICELLITAKNLLPEDIDKSPLEQMIAVFKN
jgi:hypothetical protein